ncbi:MAG: Stk1 family PASTA domain-containing Ser/Thr kinase [Agathobacter sp.]
MLENGMFLIERYEILSKVGAGGMSDVYKAKDHVLGRIVAIKVLKAEFSEDVNFVTKFRTEAQSAAGLEHPNIVNIYDVGSENGLHFIVMEYVEGITLKTYVEKKGQLSFKEATSIAIQVARGIEAAHSKEIIHRDIKPQNVIISTEGKVKVTDFGIARAISANTISAEVMGSVHYASPEQARNGFVDGRSDIYSLGIVMYEMVTGRVPFDGDSTVSVAIQHLQEEMVEPSAYAPELPISYEKIVLKATQKNPDRRYQTIEELLADLRKALANPEEDFVVIAPATVAKTRVIGGEELEAIQNSAANADLEKENVYANTQDDDELDAYDDLDDEDEDKGILNPKFDKAVNIALIILAIAIVGVIIWLCTSVLNLFKPGDTNPSQKPGSSITGTDQPGTSETGDPSETNSSESETGNMVEMPKIVGWDQSQAETLLEALGLQMVVLTNEEDSGQPDGTVLSQSEPEGAMIAPGTTIYVTIAGDVASVVKKEIPSVIGMDEQTAKQTLYDHNFKVEIDYEYSNTIEAGLVSSQNPEVGKKVKEGTVVTIYISLGKAPVEVPSDLEGKDVKVATYILEQLGFTVKTTLEYRDDMDKDLVISVPEAGTTKDYGSEIELIVSAKENGSEDPDTPPTPVYKYVGIIQEIPEGAKWYTYVLYDATDGVLSESTDMIAISGSGITITVEDLSTDSGHIVVTWYGDADEDGTPDATSMGEYTGETVSFDDVTPANGTPEGTEETEPTSEPGTTDTPEA